MIKSCLEKSYEYEMVDIDVIKLLEAITVKKVFMCFARKSIELVMNPKSYEFFFLDLRKREELITPNCNILKLDDKGSLSIRFIMDDKWHVIDVVGVKMEVLNDFIKSIQK